VHTPGMPVGYIQQKDLDQELTVWYYRDCTTERVYTMGSRVKSFEDAVEKIENYKDHTRFMKKYFYRFAKSFAKIGLDPFRCKHCGITEHNGRAILMDIDHINGDYLDGRLSNLRFLCPNCHSQTDTFKNRVSTVEDIFEQKINMCKE